MGTEITREKFSERDYARFTERLERCLADLGQLLGRPGFGAGPATVGAELELFLVDGAAQPLPLKEHEHVQLTIRPTTSWVQETYGICGWKGGAEDADRFATDPELDFPPPREEP